MTSIYKLLDPETKRIRYVGKTKNPRARFQAHARGHLRWFIDLKERGMSPILEIIEWVDDEIAARRETFWIRKLIADGHDLLNEKLLETVEMKTVHISQDTLDAIKLAALLQRKTVSSLVEETLIKHLTKTKETKR